MAACVAASISPVSGPGQVEDDNLVTENFESFARPALQNALREDILQAYMMVAVEIAAGGHGSCPANMNAAASSSSRRVTDVPVERDVGYVEAMQKGLHDLHGSVHSPCPAPHQPPVEEISDDAIVNTRNVWEVVSEPNNVNGTSLELRTKLSNGDCGDYLEVPVVIRSPGDGEGCEEIGDAEVAAVVPDEIGGADENSTTATEFAGMAADHVASDGRPDFSKNSADVDATPTDSVDPIRGSRRSSDGDDQREISEIWNKREVVPQNEAAEVPEHYSHITGVNFEGNVNQADIDSPSKVDVHHVDPALKIKVSSTGPVNVDVVHNADNVAVVSPSFSFTGLNHVAFCVESLERSLDFYCGLLGLKTNRDRPDLPYRGAWLFLGAEGIHLMQVPNPDPVSRRPAHGGFDRHACLNCRNVEGVRLALEKAGIPYQPSIVPSVFTRDPDGNGLEFIEVNS